MPFTALPNELVLETANYLDTKSLSRLSSVSWRYRSLLEGDLFKNATASDVEKAAFQSNVELVRYFLDHNITGIDPLSGTWAIFKAFIGRWGRRHFTDYRLDYRTDCRIIINISVDITSLFVVKAIELGRFSPEDTIKLLKDILTDVSLPNRGYNHSDPSGSKTVNLIELLLSLCGGKPIDQDMYLQAMYDPRVFQLLLNWGGDVNSYIRDTPSILHFVLDVRRSVLIDYRNDNTIVRMLLDAGADPNRLWVQRHSNAAPDMTSLPLALAAAGENTDIVTMLIEAGADVNGQEEISWRCHTRPLIDAVENCKLSFDRQLQLIRKLLETGADPNVHAILLYDRGGPSILDIVLMSRRRSEEEIATTIGLLIDHGADLGPLDYTDSNFAKRHPPYALFSATEPIDERSPRILLRVALDKKIPSLLPADYMLLKTEVALCKLEKSRQSRGNTSAVRNARRDLRDCWNLCRPVYDTFSPDQLPNDFRQLWDQHHEQIERLLESSAAEPLRYHSRTRK
ncbi:hypothetical protein BU16DRAFT_564757 [Lophium mytilinum]|uniref:F-box domain-containing protein n=1 Tax=Lophium mytilinum TaxID=390894 RepID=A0A6A6QJ83_9PEZI|nr:hypothetical protein BU16DRAFT_564757 [Lophium mytilinum]